MSLQGIRVGDISWVIAVWRYGDLQTHFKEGRVISMFKLRKKENGAQMVNLNHKHNPLNVQRESNYNRLSYPQTQSTIEFIPIQRSINTDFFNFWCCSWCQTKNKKRTAEMTVEHQHQHRPGKKMQSKISFII